MPTFSHLSDQHWCNLDWATFRNLGIKCEEDQIFPIYNEHPVFELPSCSMITHYQFVGKRFKQHFFMISGYNPKLRRNFQEGLRIEVCRFDFHWEKSQTPLLGGSYRVRQAANVTHLLCYDQTGHPFRAGSVSDRFKNTRPLICILPFSSLRTRHR